LSNVQPVAPPPLPAAPTWAQNLLDDGHSLQFKQYQQLPPAVAPPQYNPVQPAPAPQSQTQYMSNNDNVSVPNKLPTAKSTLYEEIDILGYSPNGRRFDYVGWYFKGAQIDPQAVMDAHAEWPESAFRHFVADFIIAFWNVTMEDAFFRIIMPLLLLVLLFKVCDMSVQRLLS
jgi:hypothetical protein